LNDQRTRARRLMATGRFEEALGVLDARNRRRRIIPACGLDFSSNDYLGLSDSPILVKAAKAALDRGVSVGSGGSRLLRGNHCEHTALETEAAAFFGTEAALFFGGGFQANQAIFTCLPAADDLVLYDEFIHASTHEGMRLGRAETRPFRHNDVTQAEDVLRAWRNSGGTGQIWIAVESIYSMEGDIAPLEGFVTLARSVDAILVVDEAHATGVFGTDGRGLMTMHGAGDLSVHTCGKGLGVSGALVCGPRVMIEILINRARPFIFATAPSPLNAALVRASLRALRESPGLLTAARTRIAHAHKEAANYCGLTGLQSQIIPVVIGDDGETMAQAYQLQEMGFDIRGIRPPTVPSGTSRLRISITGHVGASDISALFEAISAQSGKGE